MTELTPERRKRTSIHEAAHATLAWLRGATIVSVEVGDDGISAGRTYYTGDLDPESSSLVSVSGVTGEFLAEQWGVLPQTETISLDEDWASSPEGRQVRLSVLEPAVAHHDHARWRREARAARLTERDVIRAAQYELAVAWRLVMRVAAALLKRGRLDGEEFLDIVQPLRRQEEHHAFEEAQA